VSGLYPIGIQLDGKRVVVVGGGPVAARRASALVHAGALVTVIAPAASSALLALLSTGALTWREREYQTGDLDGAWLVHTATGDSTADSQVSADAERNRVWCVNAGDRTEATAWMPAVLRREDVTVSVAAGGDPRRAIALRDAIGEQLDGHRLPTARLRPRPAGGIVHLIGGGPGDPGLITVRGRDLLADADVVVVDRLAPRSLLSELCESVLIVDVGKLPGKHPVPQDEINRMLVTHARAGRRVARLKGGDPYVLGRGGEEAEYCRAHGVDVEVIPGVTSAISVPAAAGIPVTHRGVANGFTVVTGHEEIATVGGGRDHTVILLMGIAALEGSAAVLATGRRGADCPVAIIENGYSKDQRVTIGSLATIADIAARTGVRSPAVVIVGDVVRLSPHARAAPQLAGKAHQ